MLQKIFHPIVRCFMEETEVTFAFYCHFGHRRRFFLHDCHLVGWLETPKEGRRNKGIGGLFAPHILADQLTLSQPGGGRSCPQHYPHPVIQAPPDFQTSRRPCNITPKLIHWSQFCLRSHWPEFCSVWVAMDFWVARTHVCVLPKIQTHMHPQV